MIETVGNTFNWDDLKFCMWLARYGTMTEVAQTLNTNIATVSRRIDRVTQLAGEPLFTKQSNWWVATDLGDSLARHAELLYDDLQVVDCETHQQDAQQTVYISGPLRVLQSGIVSNFWKLLSEHKTMDIAVSMYPASLAYGETDIRLSSIEPTSGRVVRRKLFDISWRAYGPKACANRYEGWVKLLSTEDYEELDQTPLYDFFGADARFSIHGVNLGASMLERSRLVSYLPTFMADRWPGLMPVPSIPQRNMPVWLSYHETRRTDTALKTVVDFLIAESRHIA